MLIDRDIETDDEDCDEQEEDHSLNEELTELTKYEENKRSPQQEYGVFRERKDLKIPLPPFAKGGT